MKQKDQPNHSNILDPNPGPLSFVVGDWDDAQNFWAAVPINGNKLAIIHQAKIVKVCRNTQSARNFIDKEIKRKNAKKVKKSK